MRKMNGAKYEVVEVWRLNRVDAIARHPSRRQSRFHVIA